MTSRVVVLVFLIAPLAACSAVSVDADYDRGADFGAFRTWDWVPASEMAEPQDANLGELTDRRIRSAIERQLAAKGMSRAPGEGRLLVAYHVGVKDRVDVYSTGYRDYGGYGYRRYGYRRDYWYGGRVETHQWKEGTLLVDLIDREAKDLVWRGKAVAAVGDYEGQEERMNHAVSRMFELYPPEP